MDISRGKKGSAHDYSLCFEAVLDKILACGEPWVKKSLYRPTSANSPSGEHENPKKLNHAMCGKSCSRLGGGHGHWLALG